MANRILSSSIFTVLFLTSSYAGASDFSLPFVNAAGLGNSYSDWATSAADASTTYTNPAGLVKINHQQIVFAPLGILGNSGFTGTTTTPSLIFPPLTTTLSGTANTHIGAFFPSFYYSKPINNCMTFGFGETVPFALGTNYAKDSVVRYLATRSQVVVIDFTPSLGIKINPQFSVGFGVDAARLAFTLNNMYNMAPLPDAENQNHLAGWGWGWHAGLLYEPLPVARIGLSFNSNMMFHSTGDSETYSPIGYWRTTNQKANAMLPARTQLSGQYDINPCWTVSGTLFYTNWSTFQQLTEKRVMTLNNITTSVTIPFEYHNTFDYSAGVNYKLTPKWILRSGFTILNTPSNSRDRGVADPVGYATIVNVGAHYQQNEALSYDVGYAHSFFQQESVNLVTPVTSASGHNNPQTNVFGAQVNWNIT